MKFYIYSFILIFSNFDTISACDNSLTMASNFSNMVIKVIKQLLLSDHDIAQDSIIEQLIDNNEKIPDGDSSPHNQDEDEALLFSRLEKKFITETHWTEFTELKRQCSEESEGDRNVFVQKLRGFKSNKHTYPLSDKELDELVDTLISIKYNAIINTLLIMKRSQDKKQFGVFNEIFDFMEKNKAFASDEKMGKQFVKKIKQIMNEERQKSIDNGKPDEFEKVFVSHGLSEEKLLLWYTLFYQFQYDYAEKNFASLVCFATSTIDLQ